MKQYIPPVGFHFLVDFSEVSGKELDAAFQSVSGLEVSLTTENLQEGGENRFELTLPNGAQYPNLVLKRGLLQDSGIIDWCFDAFNDLKIKPVNLLVSLLNSEHNPLLTWKIFHAWPVKWAVSEFNAEQSSLVVESLELKYNYFTLE